MHDLPRPGHVPVDAQDVLRGGVTVPGEVGEGVDEELAHVAVALSPKVAAYLERQKKFMCGCDACVYLKKNMLCPRSYLAHTFRNEIINYHFR